MFSVRFFKSWTALTFLISSLGTEFRPSTASFGTEGKFLNLFFYVIQAEYVPADFAVFLDSTPELGREVNTTKKTKEAFLIAQNYLKILNTCVL